MQMVIDHFHGETKNVRVLGQKENPQKIQVLIGETALQEN